MTRFQAFLASAGLAITLSACAATTPPVEVTRFHNAPAEPVRTGSFVINFASDGDNRPLENGIYGAAVTRELQRVGFTDAGTAGGNGQYVVRVSVDQSFISAGGQRSPVSVGVGGNTGSYGSGVGVGIGINLGGRPKAQIATDLSVRITKRTDQKVVWEGRSSVIAKEGSAAAQPGLAAAKLAEALFRDFPGESGTTIRVP